MRARMNQCVVLASLLAWMVPSAALAEPPPNQMILDFAAAKKVDISYSVATTQVAVDQVQASSAGSAYYPSFKISYAQLPDESKTRRTLTFTQPLVSVERYFSLKEENPRQELANLRYTQAQQDLAKKLYKALKDYVLFKEKIQLNELRITALTSQVEASKQTYKLGVGTVTEVYDSELRFAQAQAEKFSLQSSLEAASRTYQAVVGQVPNSERYTLLKEQEYVNLPPLQEFYDLVMATNLGVRISKLNEVLGELNYDKSRAALIPSLNATSQQTSLGGADATRSSGVRLSLDVPLDMAYFYRLKSTKLEFFKQQEQTRNAVQSASLDAQRLYTQVQSSQREIRVRRQAVEASRLSLEATEQGFIGGVRTRLDILNAIRSVYDSEVEYLNSVLDLGTLWLDMYLTASFPVDEVLTNLYIQFFQSDLQSALPEGERG